ncbi:monovalent cation/H+ antiporter complex subunit F [Nesterenkonia sp. YGD6]|uniref:monovalent cation/H+ antiporter complex subunit F n=1 Tax=Nesterenkonia sp. YGD6 TaxID=2901231 RepID=UPI001F4C5D0C|nr:monovalent cation/H+ antiporter complex subunit F [Nesterenkonia sp. YGD6]MCH8562273.1 monovalent cation/H+ antiporter complex subunit F [Nesterenkonia sp. YGD6]
MLDIAVHITQVLLAIGAIGSVYRIYKGPSVLDRVISLDVMLIIVASMMIVDMVVNDHQDFIMFVVITAVIGFLGAVAIARYVVVRSPEEVASESSEQDPYPAPPLAPAIPGAAAESEPEAPHDPVSTPRMPGIEVEEGEDESTSWFSALTRSGFTPRRHDDASADAEEAPSADTPARPPAQKPSKQEDRDA